MIGKLKRVQNNRVGGANVVLYKSLKNIRENVFVSEGSWTIVIQARGFIVLRQRDDLMKCKYALDRYV